MNKITKIIINSILGCLVIVGSLYPVSSLAENQPSLEMNQATDGYNNYRDKVGTIYSGSAIEMQSQDNTTEIKYGETGRYIVDVTEAAHYYVRIHYMIPNEHVLPTALEVRVNGKFPYDELRNITFQNVWRRDSEPILDRYENEIVPDVHQVKEEQMSYLFDSSGR